MALLIAVLEPDPSRAKVMDEWLADRLYMYERWIGFQPAVLADRLEARASDLLVVSVGCGRYDGQVYARLADVLIEKAPHVPVLIHADREADAARLLERLETTGRTVKCLAPAAGDWVSDVWYPAVRTTIQSLSSPPMTPDEIEARITELMTADEQAAVVAEGWQPDGKTPCD